MHQSIPTISSTTINPADQTGGPTFSLLHRALTKTHGVLMIVAWPVLAGTAVLFPAFLKPVLKKGKWFQVGCCMPFTFLPLSSLFPPSLIL